MGALHAGHASLIDHARAECGTVIVSIFVNPLQFDRQDDLERYPRQLDADLELCGAHGVDVVFAPDTSEMYARPPACTVDVGSLADHLCGPQRPGHFRGVATVVLKLLNAVQTDRAYFGEKDFQQLAIVRRMAEDFNLGVDIVGLPTVREADGLAMSSRNVRLDPTERHLAPSLYQALTEAARQIANGVRDVGEIKRASVAMLPRSDRLRLEYFEIVDPDDLQPVETVSARVCIAAAIWVGSTRLIDNLLYTPDER
jgi:pantoate--beta-alanine ligase